MENEKSAELSFVTKKGIFTFNPPVCVPTTDGAVHAAALLCEYETREGNEEPKSNRLRVLGHPNGYPKMAKSVRLYVNYGHIISVAEVE